MEYRSEVQTVFGPTPGEGQRIAIGAASVRSAALTLQKEHHYYATKACWIRIGDNAVVAVAADFPLSAGAVYRWTPHSSLEQYIAVIEDASVTTITGYLFIGQSEI